MIFTKKLLPVLLLFLPTLLLTCLGDSFIESIANSPVTDFRGFYKREHSLTRPYQGAGMEVPYWEIIGSIIVSQDQIRLTADIQSLKGAIWNKMPCMARDWELLLNFKVHGSTGSLFGDGFAVWYVQDPYQLGEVFGSKDFFRGLAVFLDTYSNHNGPHGHSHPYISAMVSNGSLHYDHDSDGTHTSLGGEHTGCEAKFRNKEHDTQILIRYVGDTLTIFTDILGEGTWKQCMSVPGVRLPTGYYFGVSAATGELSDNHDIISIRMFEQDYARVEREGEGDRKSIEPQADSIAAPRDHVDDKRPSKLGWIGTTLLVIVGIVVCVGALGFGVAFFQKRQERSRKRFY